MDIDKFLNQHENKDLLRFITCGSVDDGKSTLIGRLLYDSKLIFDDQLSALKKDSEKIGNAGEGEIDYALLLDGLKAEREQGITIDVAYRYFSTPKRKFIIADTPGHEQYTRNMATGASTAELAIILVDSRYGVITQTKRHSFIVSLLGIKNVVVAVNKMDLCDYSKNRFEEIKTEFEEFAERLDIPNVTFIPLSALKGDNVVDKSEHTPWYEGQPLLEVLETVDVTSDRNFNDFRYPVQYVNRPNLDFRGFAGTVASGVVQVGDKVKALPSGRESSIDRIVTADGDLPKAFAGQAITLTLADEIDISSGEMIVHSENSPKVTKNFEAVLIWMSDDGLKPNGTYAIKHTTRTTKARIEALKYNIDVNTLEKKKQDGLALNEIGRVIISTHQPLFIDPYSKNRQTGNFILVDQLTNNTVAAGMIIEHVSPKNVPVSGSEREVIENHIARREFAWEEGMVSARDRAARYRHKGKAVIVTGAKGVGKHDIAKRLEFQLFNNSLNTYYMGLGNVLEGLDADISDDLIARDEHLRRLGELARIMTDAGLIFITAIDNLDSYELENLRLFNSPNELIVVNLGEHDPDGFTADLNLPAYPAADQAITAIMNVLGKQNIIPEYCI